MPELSVIIPVYNEQDIIQTVLTDWYQTLETLKIDFEIHAYNDGSTDKSKQSILELLDRYPHIKYHDHPNMGHGPTILKGYLENANSDWIFQVDSDNELKPNEFLKFWSQKDDFDFLIGIRKNRVSPTSRQFISLISRLSIRLFYGKGVIDVNCPFRLMRTPYFKDFFKLIPSHTFAPNVIISGISSANNYRIHNLEVDHIFRQTGSVSIKKWKLLKSAYTSFWQTIQFSFLLNNQKSIILEPH